MIPMKPLRLRLTRRAFCATAGLGFGLAATGLPAPALAQSADELKRQGLAGESLDGFLVARDSSVADRVAQLNAERRRLYEQRAAQEGIEVSAVARIYAQQIIEASPPGTWYQSGSGQWVQK